MPHVPESRTGLPPGRYGTPRKFPLWLAVPLVAVGAVAAVLILLSGARQMAPDTRAKILGYAIDSDTEVTATIELHKPANATATCTLQARNFYSDAVGTAQVVVRESVTQTQITRSFPTSEKAVVVEVTGCEQSTD